MRSAKGKLAADRGQVVPVVLGDELVGFSQVKRDGLQPVPVSCQTICDGSTRHARPGFLPDGGSQLDAAHQDQDQEDDQD